MEFETPVYGLTGGIASGKSTVARMFNDLGVYSVDADAISRLIFEKGEEGYLLTVEAFGSTILDGQDQIDRKKLGERVFQNPEARKRLEAITHPVIFKKSMEMLMQMQGMSPFLFYDAALLVENGSYKLFPKLIVVAVDEEVQLSRLMERNEISREEAMLRIRAQLPLSEKIKLADEVIWNNAGLSELEQQVKFCYERLVA